MAFGQNEVMELKVNKHKHLSSTFQLQTHIHPFISTTL